jgi:hypothetical protein
LNKPLGVFPICAYQPFGRARVGTPGLQARASEAKEAKEEQGVSTRANIRPSFFLSKIRMFDDVLDGSNEPVGDTNPRDWNS